jgi:UDP-glucose 4-epimerase
MENSKTVIVTGGAGFIGKYLVRKILRASTRHRVIVIDSLCNSTWNNFISFLLENNLCDWPSSKIVKYDFKPISGSRISFYRVDIRNKAEIARIFEKEKEHGKEISGCIHLAARISVAESMLKPVEVDEVNVNGTRNVIDCAFKADIKNFVLASSAAVYGNPTRLPISEFEPTKPISKYGETKLNAERVVASYSSNNQRAISLRLFNVYGIGQTMDYAGVISKFADRIRRNLSPVIYGSGLQTRDFIHVEDAADALMRSAGLTGRQIDTSINFARNVRRDDGYSENDVPGELSQAIPLRSGVFNIGTGIPTNVRDLADIMIEILAPHRYIDRKKKLRPIYIDAVNGDINESYADIRKARHGLGFGPTVNLRTGLEDVLIRNNTRRLQ